MNRQITIAAVVLFLLAVVGLFALTPRNTQRVQSKFLGLVSPFLSTGSSLQQRFTAFQKGLETLDDLERKTSYLTVQNKELKATNQTLRGLEEENNRLRRALEYRERSVFALKPARVIARDASSWWNTVKINRGFEDGIAPDMPVLTDEGLVGKTTVVAAHMSTVVLVSDENCKVAAKIEGTQEQGIVHGERTSNSTTPRIAMSFLTKNADLKPSQKVYSSGLGGVYPSGVLVGSIKEYTTRELDGYATIVPAVDLTTLEDVFVVAGKRP